LSSPISARFERPGTFFLGRRFAQDRSQTVLSWEHSVFDQPSLRDNAACADCEKIEAASVLSAIPKSGLVYSSDAAPGICRKSRRRGFSYHGPDGAKVVDAVCLERIRLLGIPPAYRDVWICIDPNGHLQATGLDARGRKQYRYHAEWQSLRSDLKFGQLARMDKALPRIRARIQRDLADGAPTENNFLAALALLLDLAHIRVGNSCYARENRTYGATTLEKRHIRIHADRLELKFVAKGGRRVQKTLKNSRLQRILEQISDLPGRKIFAWKDQDGHAHCVDSGRLNAYLCDIAGMPMSAKSFRTWGSTLAAFRRAVDMLDAQQQPGVRQLCEAAAEELHNTPAICRKSYVHPDVLALAEKNDAVLERFNRWRKRAPKPRRGLTSAENLLLAFLRSSVLG